MSAFSQQRNADAVDSAAWLSEDEPTAWLPSSRHCKFTTFEPVYLYEYVPVVAEPVVPNVISSDRKKVPFLQVHGNIMYNVNYFSNIDTPYNEQNIYQHTVQTYLDITIKNKYPMRVYLTNRFSNSDLFRNLSDFNFSYNNTQFKQTIKEQVRKQFSASLPSPKAPDSLRSLLDSATRQLQMLEQWIKNPALLQKMVEARERALKQRAKKRC